MRYLALILAVSVLGGCASTPNESALYKDPTYDTYCNTKQEITVKNGETVDSVTKLNCSDNLLDKVVMNKTTIDGRYCNFFRNNFIIGGRNVSKTGIWCTLPNGDHVIVDDDIHN